TIPLSPPALTAPATAVGTSAAGATVAVTGTGLTGATVSVLDGGTAIGTATVSGGAFSASVALGFGSHLLTATQTLSGLTSAGGTPLSLIVTGSPTCTYGTIDWAGPANGDWDTAANWDLGR